MDVRTARERGTGLGSEQGCSQKRERKRMSLRSVDMSSCRVSRLFIGSTDAAAHLAERP